jgi:glyoxylase-like metal-dependent hydrolase (beta-lactamase superfamily II)
MLSLFQWCLTPLILQATDLAPRTLIDSALARLGGAEHIRAQRSWFVAGTGEENLAAELQGLTPVAATVRAHAEWLGVDTELEAVAWERRTPRNDNSLRWRRFLYRPDSTGFIVWTDSIAVMNPGASPLARRRGMMRRIPHLLLLEAARADSLSLGASGSIAGRPHREVRVRLDDVWVSLWISADSSLLRRAEYRTSLPGRGEVAVRWEWPTWMQGTKAALRPTGHEVFIDSRSYQRVEYQRFEGGTAAADSLLQVPNVLTTHRRPMTMEHRAAATNEAPLPTSGEVLPGLHVAEVGGFNVFIVEFSKFVLLVETPAAHPGFESIPATRAPDRIAQQLTARIREIARGRPLGYTVLTHHHSDHVGNAAALSQLSQTFLVPTDAKPMIDAAIPGGARVELIRGSRTIRDSSRSVVIYDVGANPHTQHNLFVWLPNERVGFQGDLFYYEEGAAGPPADRLPISEFFARWLRERGISPRAIYGVHSRGSASSEVFDAVLANRVSR